MNNKLVLRILTVMLVLVVGFGVVGSASAILKNTAVFDILADDTGAWEHSTVSVNLDGNPTYVVAELGNSKADFYYIPFGDVDYDTNDPDTADMCETIRAASLESDNPNQGSVVLCDGIIDDPELADPTDPLNEYGDFAGLVELGIPRSDVPDPYTTTLTAKVFAFSDAWSVIDCDLNGDGDPNNDKSYDIIAEGNIPTPLAPWSTDSGFETHFKIMSIDFEDISGNAQSTELVTTIFIDLDVDDSGSLEQCGIGQEPSTGVCELPYADTPQGDGKLCFFAAVYPVTYSPGDLVWSGQPPQARFSSSGGDKTVSLDLFGPSAITLEQLVAQSPGGIHPYVWAAIFVLLTGIAFVLIRESRQQVFIRKDE